MLPLAGIVLLAGCGDDPADEAMGVLREAGYAFDGVDFHRAARDNDARGVGAFLASGMSVDMLGEDGLTPLATACRAGAVDAARVLLDAEADGRGVGPRGRTPLMLAAEAGSAPLCRLLIERGADARVRDEEGWHALALAVWHGQAAAAELLAGQAPAADVDESLLLAALNGQVEMADMLLRRGGSVMVRDADGRTPLMLAAAHGHPEMARLLMDNGANRFELTGEEGWTAAQLAAGAAEAAERGGDADKARACRATARLLASPPEPGEESGHFHDPRPLVLVGDGPVMPETAARIASGEVRPAEAMDGAVLPVASSGNLGNAWEYTEYRVTPLPFVIDGVSPDGGTVRVRPLYGDHQVVEVRVGATVPGSGWRVKAARHALGERKGDGTRVETSTATFSPPGPGPDATLATGERAQAARSLGVLESTRDGTLLAVREGDTFRMGEAGKVCRVVAVDPEKLVVAEEEGGETFKVAREREPNRPAGAERRGDSPRR